ncbi:unnamed protein product [Closterium sp. Naga37s-1]|nr:unnamed protein product [Closterium sp. Naga37s-1]
MEPDGSIESASVIRVVVLQVGEITASAFRTYSSLIMKHRVMPLQGVFGYYKEHQKSPFSHQPWTTGSLRFNFILGGSSRSPWQEFVAQRKIHGVIGVCHCPRMPDTAAAYEEFVLACKAYPLAQVKRCIAFDPTTEQMAEEDPQRRNLVILSGADQQRLEALLVSVMHDFAACVLMALESWVLHVDPIAAIFLSPLDNPNVTPNEDAARLKKKRLARIQKAIGDYCLLAGSPLDARNHYGTAIELGRLTNSTDPLWLAGALEGHVSTLAVEKGRWDEELEEEIRTKYSEIVPLYRKAGAMIFELEALIKVARFICRKEMARDVVDLLAQAVETGRGLQNPSDLLVLYIEVARIFQQLGYERKAAFFTRQVAKLYEQQESRFAAVSALQVLALASTSYKVQSLALSPVPSPALADTPRGTAPGSAAAGGGGGGGVGAGGVGGKAGGKGSRAGVTALESSAPPLGGGQWSRLQMELLSDMLAVAVRAGEPLAAWAAAARLLRGFYPLILPQSQESLAQALTSASERLPAGTCCPDLALPFVRFHAFATAPQQTQVVKRTRGKRDWWVGAGGGGPFIYTPFTTRAANVKPDMVWIVGEVAQVIIELSNPCACAVDIESIYLNVDGDFQPFPASLSLRPNTYSHLLTLSGLPRSPGVITVLGCFLQSFGVLTDHRFADTTITTVAAAAGSAGSGAGLPLIPGMGLVDPFSPAAAASVAANSAAAAATATPLSAPTISATSSLSAAAAGVDTAVKSGASAGRGFLASSPIPSTSVLPVLDISVLPELPLLVATAEDGDGAAAVLFDGEVREISVKLVNSSRVPVVDAFVSVAGRQKRHLIVLGQEKLAAALPLLPGAAVTLPVKIVAQFQPESSEDDEDDVGGGEGGGGAEQSTSSKEEDTVNLVVHYAGPDKDPESDPVTPAAPTPVSKSATASKEKEKERKDDAVPGRRLSFPINLCVRRGLSLVRARLLVTGGVTPAVQSDGGVASTGAAGGGAAGGGANLAASGRGGGAEAGLTWGSQAKGAGAGGGGAGVRKGVGEMEVPVRQAKGLRLLDLEVWNGTDSAFDVSVLVDPPAPHDQPSTPAAATAPAAAAPPTGAAAGGATNASPAASAAASASAGSLLAASLLPPASNLQASLEEASLLASGGSVSHSRIGRDCAARLLIPLGGFDSLLGSEAEAALAVLHHEEQTGGDTTVRRQLALGLGPIPSPFTTIINAICSRVKVRWLSARNFRGEVRIREAVRAVVESQAVAVLLPDPLAFSFRVTAPPLTAAAAVGVGSAGRGGNEQRETSGLAAGDACAAREGGSGGGGAGNADGAAAGGSGGGGAGFSVTSALEFTTVELTVTNQSKGKLAVSVSVTCRDVTGETCVGEATQKQHVMWAGTLNGIDGTLDPGQSLHHKLSLCFLVPGEYTLFAAAVVDNQGPSPTSLLTYIPPTHAHPTGTLNGIDATLDPGLSLHHKLSLCFLVPGEYTLFAAAVVDNQGPSPTTLLASHAQLAGRAGHTQNPNPWWAVLDASRRPQTICCTSLPHAITVLGAA